MKEFKIRYSTWKNVPKPKKNDPMNSIPIFDKHVEKTVKAKSKEDVAYDQWMKNNIMVEVIWDDEGKVWQPFFDMDEPKKHKFFKVP